MQPFQIHLADSFQWLATLPDKSVSLVLTDPAYESLEKHRARGTTTRLSCSFKSSNVWFPVFANSRFEDLFAEFYRVLEMNSHLYLFCDAETMFHAKPAGEKAGFRFWKPLVWNKMRIGMGYHYRCSYEFILFFEKGKRALANRSTPDILSFPRIVKGYPTEKPVPLCKTLVQQSTAPGEIVLDPFMGAGSTGVAAVQLQRRFWGADILPTAFHIAEHRLASLPSVSV